MSTDPFYLRARIARGRARVGGIMVTRLDGDQVVVKLVVIGTEV